MLNQLPPVPESKLNTVLNRAAPKSPQGSFAVFWLPAALVILDHVGLQAALPFLADS